MKLFTNKEIKNLFAGILLCILIFLSVSIIVVFFVMRDTAFYILTAFVCMAAAILLICYKYFYEQSKIIENATAQITEYMAGNHNARIECDNEGELYKLFHKVNSLVTVLNAHIENELQAKLFLKDTISNISHQLKTPLAALNIYNGILQDEAQDLSTIQKFTALSEQELDRIESLVQGLLKISKLDAGTITLDKSSANLFELISSVQKHFAFRAEYEGKEIIIAGDHQVTLFCDRIWIIEAIDNIVKNALDHTAKGGTIRIEWKQFAAVVQIIIMDNGSGIHPEDVHHIFKRFYRSRFSKDTQGIGLGLPLAKTIIEAHSGTIEVSSELGIGTTFILNFLIPTKL